MPLPDKKSKPTPDNVEQMYDGLTEMISDHAEVQDDCSFYNKIDEYLGPWGQEGYPIGYGHFYCVAFGSDAALQKDPVAKEWLMKTRIRLQELLRDIIVDEFRAGRLPTLSRDRLKELAFDSHPRAYDEGGLRQLNVLTGVSVGLVPVKEFVPFHGNALRTWEQFGITFAYFAGESIGDFVVSPLNVGETESLDAARLPAELEALRSLINDGRADYPPLLQLTISRLRSRAFPNSQTRAKASEIIRIADRHLSSLKQRYNAVKDQTPEAAKEITRKLDQICDGGFYSCDVSSFSQSGASPENRSRIPQQRSGGRSSGPVGHSP